MRKSQRRIQAGYLSRASNERAYDWLRDAWSPPGRGNYHGRWETDYSRIAERDLLEHVLLQRHDALIDLGVAQFGYSRKALLTVFARGDRSVRCAVLANPQLGQGWHAFEGPVGDVVSRSHPCELEALAGNSFLPDDAFAAMIRRGNEFASLTDAAYALVLRTLGGNQRLATLYDQDNRAIDGWSDAQFHSVVSAAWELTRTLPATEAWAAVLVELLRHAQPWQLTDVHHILHRWTRPSEGDEVQASPDLRMLLADLLPADEELLRSDDLSVRQSFYRRFSPQRFRNWPTFFERDGEDFATAAIILAGGNHQLWRDPAERARLAKIAVECDALAGRHDFWIENLFRSQARDLKLAHPDWFFPGATDDDEEEDFDDDE